MRGCRWWGAREVERASERARAGRESERDRAREQESESGEKEDQGAPYLRVARGRRLCPEGDELVGPALGVRRDQHVVLRLGF